MLLLGSRQNHAGMTRRSVSGLRKLFGPLKKNANKSNQAAKKRDESLDFVSFPVNSHALIPCGAFVDFLPFSKLTQINISPRVRNVLESAYQLCWRELEQGTKRTLDEFERELFRNAEKAATTDLQNRCFEASKVLRKSNSAILIAMRNDFQRGMLTLLQPEREPEKTQKQRNLALVDNTTLELELAISELAAKAEIKSSQALNYLAIRFSVITGGAPVLIEHIPVGPHRILAALAAGLSDIELSMSVKVSLLRTFDKTLLVRMPELLDAMNKQFAEQRVFAHLNFGISRKPDATADAKPSEKNAAADPASVSQEQAAPPSAANSAKPELASPLADAPTAAPVKPVGAKAPENSDPFGLAAMGTAFSASPAFNGHLNQRELTKPASPANPPPPAAAPSQTERSTDDVADRELFTTLRELLAGKRAGLAADTGHSDHMNPEERIHSDAPIASVEDVQSILTVLQTQPAAPVMIGGRWKSRRVVDIKQEMISQLRQLHGGKTPQLEQETSDTLDLVGMLFDHVLADSKASSTTHSLLTKLQVPILKVAIKDKSFFSKRNHPARQLLNSIAENGMFWADGDDTEHALVERMQMVVDRITADFDNDVGVFETMVSDLGRHVTTVQRKAEVSEKRYVEAAKGRERLEVARKSAASSIDGFVKGRMLPPLVVHLLEGAWADVLALTQLRHAVDSPLYQERLEVAEQLAGCFDLDEPVSKNDFLELKPVLEEGMSLVGFHGPEIERTLNAVAELVVEGDALVPSLEPAEEREVTELVRSKARIGQDQDAPKTQEHAAEQEKKSILAHLRKEEKPELSVKEQQTLDRLKQMPFGTWFEFVVNQQGDVARRKLSWFSPVTGRCLFVNSRGAKVAEKSMDEMARDLVRGNAKLWEPQAESVIDRAWRSIKEKMKTWTQNDMSVSELAHVGSEK